MADNEIHPVMREEIYKLRSLPRKKSMIGRITDDVFIEFSGADTVIAGILPQDEKNLLLRMGIINIYLCIIAITGIGYIFYFSFEKWVATILLIVVAAVISYCVKTSIGAGLLHYKKQAVFILFIKRVFLALCFLISLAGIAMWIFSQQINKLADEPYYEFEYNKYRNDLAKLNTSDPIDSPNDKYLIADYLTNATGHKKLLQVDAWLTQKKREILASIPSYDVRIQPDDTVQNTLPAKETGPGLYADILPVSFSGKNITKTGKIYNLPGITFVPDSIGNIKVFQNYYDSIFIANSLIDSIYATQNVLNFLLRNANGKAPVTQTQDSVYAGFETIYNTYFLNNILKSAYFMRIQSATKLWLQQQVKINNEPVSACDKMMGFYLLISADDSRIIVIVMVLLFIAGFLYQLIKSNLEDLRKSKYPVLVNLYQNVELTRIESIEEGLSDNKIPYTKFLTKEDNRKQSKSRLSQIQNFGTIGYYIQSGEELEEAGDYDAALEKYSRGYEKFPDAYEFLKMRADVFLKKNDVNQSLEYLKLYNEKRNKVTVENNLRRNLSIAFFEMKDHPFYGNLTWPLNKQMNILLGKNGYGKSHLLSIMLALVQNDIEKTKEFSPAVSKSSNDTPDSKAPAGDYNLTAEQARKKNSSASLFNSSIFSDNDDRIDESMDDKPVEILVAALSTDEIFALNAEQNERLENIADQSDKESLEEDFQEEFKKISFSKSGLNSFLGKIPVLAISDTRFIDKSANLLSRSHEHIDIRLDSAKHFLEQKPYGGVIENALYRICQSYLERGQAGGKNKMFIIDLIEKIFFELTGNHFELKKIESKENTEYEMLVSTEGADRLPIQKVSQGTFSVISIVLVIYNYLRARYLYVSDTEVAAQQAIVFIDEVDAHLHPSWQQKIVNILRRTFPAVQFFLTAHSPLVVAGSRKGEVAVLRKAQKGFEMEFFENDFIGYQPEELFRQIFEMESYDETYLKYNALLPFKESFEKNIIELTSKKTRSYEEDKKLAKLYEDVYYINVVAQRTTEIRKEEEMKNESATAGNLPIDLKNSV